MDTTLKPQFVLEVEKRTGLTCQLDETSCVSPYWWVMSPTGVPLFKIGGRDNMIGSTSHPDMFDLQGVDAEERSRRRRQG